MCLLSVLYSIYISSVVMKAQAVYYRGVKVLPFFLLLAAILAGYGVIFNTVYPGILCDIEDMMAEIMAVSS